MPCAMWWPANAQSELISSGSSLAMALNTGLPIFIGLSKQAVFTPRARSRIKTFNAPH